jgi:type IV secretory pathway TraG/TraD family ATPase VirD4
LSIESRFYDLTHGWHGIITVYLLIAVFSLAGLKRGRADMAQYFFWPFSAAATLVVVGIAVQLLTWLTFNLAGLNAGEYGNTMLAMILYMIGGYLGGLYWSARGKPLADAHGRGAMVIDGASVQEASRKLRVKAKALPPAQMPLTVAGVAVSPQDEVNHFKFMGTTGTGKSTLMRELLHAALWRGDRAVIADPDGGYLSKFYTPKRGDVILNPFDARSAKWDVFAEIRNPYDVDELAQAFIPDRGSDPTWTGFARTLFSAITRQAHMGGITDVEELYRLLVIAPKEELQGLVAATAAAPFLTEGSDKLFQGARSTVTAAVKSLDFIRTQKAELFSVRQWVKSGKGVLFLPYQADQISALKAIISIWMRLAIFQTMSLGEGDHRLWFAVDELAALGPIDGLPDALTRLRKFGGRCVIGLQSIAQASTTYGMGTAQAVVENCGTSVILRCSASEGGGTARYASRLIGDRDVVRLTRSSSRSSGAALGSDRDTEGHSEHHSTEAAVLPSEIEQLPDRSGFLKIPSQPAWMRVSFPVYDIPKVAEPFVEV